MSSSFIIDKIINLGYISSEIKEYIEKELNNPEKIDLEEDFPVKNFNLIKFDKNFLNLRCFKLRNDFSKLVNDPDKISNIIILNEVPDDIIKFGKNYYAFGKIKIKSNSNLLNLNIFFGEIKRYDFYRELISKPLKSFPNFSNKIVIYDECLDCVVNNIDDTFKNKVVKFVVRSELSDFYYGLLTSDDKCVIKNIDKKLLLEVKDFTNKIDSKKDSYINNFFSDLKNIELDINRKTYILNFKKKFEKSLKFEDFQDFTTLDVSEFSLYEKDIDNIGLLFDSVSEDYQINWEVREDILELFGILEKTSGLEKTQIFSVQNDKSKFPKLKTYIDNFNYSTLLVLPAKTKLIRLPSGDLTYFSSKISRVGKLKIGNKFLFFSEDEGLNNPKSLFRKILREFKETSSFTLNTPKPRVLKPETIKYNTKKNSPFEEILLNKKPFIGFDINKMGAKFFFDHESEHAEIYKKVLEIEKICLVKPEEYYYRNILKGNMAIYPVDYKIIDDYFNNFPENKEINHFLKFVLRDFKKND